MGFMLLLSNCALQRNSRTDVTYMVIRNLTDIPCDVSFKAFPSKLQSNYLSLHLSMAIAICLNLLSVLRDNTIDEFENLCWFTLSLLYSASDCSIRKNCIEYPRCITLNNCANY